MSNAKRSYLICYDICEPRRLRRVHRLVRDHARPLQYSIFIGELNPAEVIRLWEALSALIEPAEDRLHLFPLFARQPILGCDQQNEVEQAGLLLLA